MEIKEYLRRNFFINSYLKKRRTVRWMHNGRSLPAPHDIKQLSVLYHAVTYKLDTLVETGTFLGDMVFAMKDYFRKIYSIELSPELFERAQKRFRGDGHIKLVQGDSSVKIAEVLSEVEKPVLFWLDGHYSGGITARGEKICPVYGELENVFKSPFPHVILIDDARLFNGEDDYPTLEELRYFVTEKSDYKMKVENDIIILSA